MSVDYSASFGYGFILGYDDFEPIAMKYGYVPFGYDNQDEAILEDGELIIDEWDFAEWLGELTGLGFAPGGNSYSDDTDYLFGEVISTRSFAFEEADLTEIDMAKVDAWAAELGVEPKWYAGMYVF